ncbi:MAG: alpha/beta hydrolase [Pseudomonadota bacterium]
MNLQAAVAKALLKLPPGWLVKMSGGGPVALGGRVLDPYLQFIAHGAKRQPPMSSMSPQDGRASAAAGLAMFAAKPEPGVAWEDFAIQASDGHDIPVRLYRPDAQDPAAPLMVYLHMGGGVIGDLETCHAFCTILASSVKGPILSVDYRLAPEHKFPAGFEDAICAYEWALKNAETYGAPPGEAAIGGDSMGGNFSAAVAVAMLEEEKPQPTLQLLVYPATDIVTDFPSRTTYGETYPLSADTMDWFMAHYMAADQDRSDLRISPAFATDFTGLAPAIIVTAGFDPLVDDGAAYAKRLKEAGVDVSYKCYDSLAHGFTAFTAVSPAADATCREIAGMVAAAYAKRR